MLLKLYTLGWVIDGPGRRTWEPVPNERTGYDDGAAASLRCASMERFWFEAHTVQNLSLEDEGVGVDDVVVSSAEPSTVTGGVDVEVDGSGGGGGGGGGFGVDVLEPIRAIRGSAAILTGDFLKHRVGWIESCWRGWTEEQSASQRAQTGS